LSSERRLRSGDIGSSIALVSIVTCPFGRGLSLACIFDFDSREMAKTALP
jgi:hypothetical protein